MAPAERDAYLASVRDVNEPARASEGCLAFVQVPDPVEADRIVIYERWESDEALGAFRTSGPQDGAAPEEPLPELLGADVHRYRISAIEPPWEQGRTSVHAFPRDHGHCPPVPTRLP